MEQTKENYLEVSKRIDISQGRKFSLVFILFIFMLLHQTDKYLISPLTT